MGLRSGNLYEGGIMKLLCVNSPVKGLIKEGKAYDIVNGSSAATTKVIFDEFGIAFYLTPVPGSAGLYQSRLGNGVFMFRIVDGSFEKHQKKLRNERRIELAILFAGAVLVTSYMLMQG